MKNKFFDFKNIAANEYALYVYGEIVSEKEPDFWTGEVSKTDIDVSDFKNALADIPNGAKLNMYVNSVGGSVFATSAIVSMLQRAKDRGVEIDAYIDGVACSCASWLLMVADKINVYKNSVMMIHKPLCASYGNADDLAADIAVLNKIEDGVIIPMYETKAKCDRKKIKDMMSAETWLTADEIAQYFNVTFIDEAKQVDNIQSDLFKLYKNTPQAFKQGEKPVADVSQHKETIDYSKFEKILNDLKGGKK